MVGLTATSSKRAYAIPRSTAPRAPASAAVHWWPVPPQETLKHSSGSICVSWCSPGLFEPSNHLWWVWGLVLNAILPLVLSYWGFSSALGHRVSFLVWSNILLSMDVQQRVVILEFSQEMSTRPSTLPTQKARWVRMFAMTSAFSWQTLLAFDLLHFVLQGQICLLLQVSLDFHWNGWI